MLAGSAIWLKYTLRGDRTGHPRSKPSWLRTFNGKPIVEGFSLDVDFGECEFLEPETGPSATLEAQNYCGLSNAMVPVTATIDAVNDNMDGLYLVVLASKDFKAWWQANAVLLPREMFALNETSLTAQRLAQLQATFDAAGLGATETTPQAGRVDITRLVQPLRDEFSGAGAVTMTASLSEGSVNSAGGGDGVGPRHLVRGIAGGAALGIELVAIGVAAEEVSVREAGERGGAGRGHRRDVAPTLTQQREEERCSRRELTRQPPTLSRRGERFRTADRFETSDRELANSMPAFNPTLVIDEGMDHGWYEHDYQWSQGQLVILRKNDANGDQMQLNIWCTTGTIGSYLNHPRRGKTQLFRRAVHNVRDLRSILENPRVHGQGGYYERDQQRTPPQAPQAKRARPGIRARPAQDVRVDERDGVPLRVGLVPALPGRRGGGPRGRRVRPPARAAVGHAPTTGCSCSPSTATARSTRRLPARAKNHAPRAAARLRQDAGHALAHRAAAAVPAGGPAAGAHVRLLERRHGFAGVCEVALRVIAQN